MNEVISSEVYDCDVCAIAFPLTMALLCHAGQINFAVYGFRIMASRAGALAAQRKKKVRSKSKQRNFADETNVGEIMSNLHTKKSMMEISANMYKQRLKMYREESIRSSAFEWQIPITYTFLKIQHSRYFQMTITGFIFLAAFMVAVQTYPTPSKTLGVVYNIIDFVILWVFVIEIVVKLLALGKSPWQYFRDRWNRFDFLIVFISFVPLPTSGNSGGIITAFRLLRLLRVLKLVKTLPKLRILVIGLFMSLNSIGYIGFLLIINFYLFACAGVGFFGKNDPVYMGDLFTAMLTLFRCSTLEDWTDVMYTAMYGCENYGYDGMEHLCVMSYGQPILASVYFLSFIVVSSLMIMNLFIGIIASSVEDAKHKLDDEALMAEHHAHHHKATPGKNLEEMVNMLNKMAIEMQNFGSTSGSKSSNGQSTSEQSILKVWNKNTTEETAMPTINKYKYIEPPKSTAKVKSSEMQDVLSTPRSSSYVIPAKEKDTLNVVDMMDLEQSIKDGFVSPKNSKTDTKLSDSVNMVDNVDGGVEQNTDLQASIDELEEEVANSPLSNKKESSKTLKNRGNEVTIDKLEDEVANSPLSVKKRIESKVGGTASTQEVKVVKTNMKAHLLTKVFDKKQLKRINRVIETDASLDEAIESLLPDSDTDEELD